LERESALFVECLQSSQSRAMRHVFFAEREAARIRGLSTEVQPRGIHAVAVVGSGTMGAGIAMCFVNVGVPVTLLEIDNDALKRGLEAISRMYETAVRRGRMTGVEVQERLQRITATTDYADVAAADLVIEAVFEDPALKRDVFQRLDEVCKPTAILASNTSYQNIDDLASVTARPQ